jgi:hypothetical protein
MTPVRNRTQVAVPASPAVRVPPILGAEIGTVVMDRAGYRCECRSGCGNGHSAGRRGRRRSSAPLRTHGNAGADRHRCDRQDTAGRNGHVVAALGAGFVAAACAGMAELTGLCRACRQCQHRQGRCRRPAADSVAIQIDLFTYVDGEDG